MVKDRASAINLLRSNVAEVEYSEWRMNQETPSRYVCDVDQIEYCGSQPVALIDIKTWPKQDAPAYWKKVLKDFETFPVRKYRELSEQLGCNAYTVYPCVNYKNEFIQAVVIDMVTLEMRRYTAERYLGWLTSLSAKQR